MYSRVYVEITNICNMHCSFCHGHTRPARKMTEAEFGKILAQLRGKTQYVYYHLMGEPLTHPQLPLFLQMAAEGGFRSVLTTNGTLLERRGEEILASGLHKVNISLHSFEEGSADAHRDYIRKTAEFAALAADRGVLVSFRLWNRGCEDERNQKAEAHLRAFLPGEWMENTRGYRIRDRIFIEWGDRFAWPDREAEDMGQSVFCYGLRDHFGVLSDGTVVPCCLDSDGVINLGNAFTQDLAEILASPRAAAILQGFSERKAAENLCRRCGYARRFHK
jgi:MoaA/NifB/PqqE/SkfB family radical SAM enzyme